MFGGFDEPGSNGPLSQRERWGLATLLLGAFALRWIVWERTVAIFNDGPRFIAIARSMAEGSWAAAIADDYHPLYPLATAGVHALGSDWETAAAVVSVVSGTLAVLFLFLFLRETFGSPVAFVGAGFLAVHSRAVTWSSDVQSEGLYLALFLAAVWLGWRALRTRRPSLAAACALASTLAYLTRPEGLGVALGVAVLGGWRTLRGRWPATRGLVWIGTLAGTTVLVAAPYVVAMRQVSGEWTLTQKKSMEQVVAGGELEVTPRSVQRLPPASASVRWWTEADEGVPEPEDRPEGVWASFLELGWKAKSSARYVFLVTLGLGLLTVAGRPSERGRFILALLSLYAVLLYALVLNVGYVSRRHTLPPTTLLFGYAGIGALMLGHWVHLGWAALRRRPAVPSALAAGSIGLALVGLLEMEHQIEPKRIDDQAERSAAEWLRDHAPAPGAVAGTRTRVGYYAGMPYAPLRRMPEGSLLSNLNRLGIRYVILDDGKAARELEQEEAAGRGVRSLHHVEASRGEAWVFEVVPDGGERIADP